MTGSSLVGDTVVVGDQSEGLSGRPGGIKIAEAATELDGEARSWQKIFK